MFRIGQEKRIPVTVTLVNGRVLRGSVLSGLSGALASGLNASGAFIEILDEEGRCILLGKPNIVTIEEERLAAAQDALISEP